ncbi:hypothetical protein V3A08_05505 [Tenacibaculum maritimum]|uniref:hypothetical protein n=4 Tax=Tenacibaculum maritimum TaxID=107401 RepID=UPI003875FCF0
MKYYQIKIDIDKLRTYPISIKMIDDYRYDKGNSVSKLKSRGKLDFVPNFNSIELIKSANPNKLDIISSVPIAGSGIIISDKLLSIIREFRVPDELQIFDVNAIHKGVNYHYNYLYQPKQKEYLNLNEMLFFETNMVGKIKKELNINTYEEYLEIIKKNKLIQIKPKQLILKKENINYDIFNLSYIGLGYYVSEKLKKAIEEKGCQGIAFIPIEE